MRRSTPAARSHRLTSTTRAAVMNSRRRAVLPSLALIRSMSSNSSHHRLPQHAMVSLCAVRSSGDRPGSVRHQKVVEEPADAARTGSPSAPRPWRGSTSVRASSAGGGCVVQRPLQTGQRWLVRQLFRTSAARRRAAPVRRLRALLCERLPDGIPIQKRPLL